MTDDELAAIEKRANEAEPDWKFHLERGFVAAGPTWGAGDLIEHFRGDGFSDEDWNLIVADARFAAAARSDIPALLAEVRRLRTVSASVLRHLERSHLIESDRRQAIAKLKAAGVVDPFADENPGPTLAPCAKCGKPTPRCELGYGGAIDLCHECAGILPVGA